ncbi:hypothetical protein GM708_14715 [Vibrio cholerae]|nr:hypothetical protein [Vibrio cholerae]
MALGASLAPRTVEIPDRVWRVALIPSGQRFSEIAPDDALLPDAGNRFDVPGGGVLYCATSPRGSYLETLAGKRVSPRWRLSCTMIPAVSCRPTASRRPGGTNAAFSPSAPRILHRSLTSRTSKPASTSLVKSVSSSNRWVWKPSMCPTCAG